MITPTLPIQRFVGDGSTLFQWMGSFWTTLYQDPQYLRQFNAGRALVAAQAYLNVLEAGNLLNRKLLPVLHRERWHPLVVRRSRRGQGGAAALKLNMEPSPVLGAQTDTAYPVRTTFKLGGAVAFADVYTYPLDVVPEQVLTCLVDNIAAPKVILVKDKDFVIQDGTLVIRKAYDPFEDSSGFAVDTVSTGTEDDQESVLWGCDVLFDRNYVYEHLGYVLGVKTDSTEYFKRLLNAVWDMVTSGASPSLFSAMLGALCGVPTVLNAAETVETVATDGNGDQLVITDKAVYRLPGNAVLRDDIQSGTVLCYGDMLDQAIRIYPALVDPRSTKLKAVTEYAWDIRQDIPAITLPPGFFRVPLQYGFCLSWDAVPIYYAGDDANGNPKLWFPLQGLEADVTAFWDDVWAQAETQGVSLETCFAAYLDDTVSYRTDAECGHVEPLEFFLRNLIGVNTILVTLNSSELRAGDRGRITPVFVELLRDTLPVYNRLFLVERRTAAVDEYSLDTTGANTDSEVIAKYASLERTSDGRLGGPSAVRLTFKDRPVRKRWVAVCR